jgi:hypothetical protein
MAAKRKVVFLGTASGKKSPIKRETMQMAEGIGRNL